MFLASGSLHPKNYMQICIIMQRGRATRGKSSRDSASSRSAPAPAPWGAWGRSWLAPARASSATSRTSGTPRSRTSAPRAKKNRRTTTNARNVVLPNNANIQGLIFRNLSAKNANRFRATGRTQRLAVNSYANAHKKAQAVIMKLYDISHQDLPKKMNASKNARHGYASVVNAVWRLYTKGMQANSLDNIVSAFQHIQSVLRIWREAEGSVGRLTASEIFSKSKLIPYQMKSFDNRDWIHFYTALRNGAFPNLTELGLDRLDIDNDGVKLLAKAIASGSLGNLERLYLQSNQIGDAGMSALAGAIASGSLPRLIHLTLDRNKIGDAGMSALAGASGSLGALTLLSLSENNISDDGMKAFAEAIASGSLGNLKALWLSDNKIGDDGMSALASEIANGSLPALIRVVVDDKHMRHPQLVAACRPRGIAMK